MKEQTAYPLFWPTGWQRCAIRSRSRFGKGCYTKPTVAQGRSLVLQELDRTRKAWRIVISTNLELRNDGLPYSNRRDPDDPGAAVYWSHVETDKRFVIACDRWQSVGENLYTIGKTIEATRAIERWGAVTADQAFAGYIALNEKTEESCWDVLGIPSMSSENIILDAYRRNARATHPDNGGDSESFSRVVMAKDIALQLIK